LADRRQRVEQMSPGEKQELGRLQRRFYGLDPDQRERLRRLHQAIDSDPQAERLRGIMTRYANWLKTLPAGERAELLSLPPEERIARIRDLLQQQARSQMRYLLADKLSDRDLAAIALWTQGIVRQRQAEILQKLPLGVRGMMDSLPPDQRGEALIRALQRFGFRPELLRPSEEDIGRLKEQLTPAAIQRLEKAQEEGRLAELAESWMRAAMAGRRLGPPVDRAELERFYREELDENERAFLESLPRERMHSRLLLLYYAHRYGRQFGREKPVPGPRGMGGGFRGRGPRFWPPDRKPAPDQPRHKPSPEPREEPPHDRRSAGGAPKEARAEDSLTPQSNEAR
jgi:hypothetical protein